MTKEMDDPQVEKSKEEAEEESELESEDREKKPKKERVLHTRVPAVLEQELKRLAQSLRMPVSNVVRAILEDAVTAVDIVGRKAEGGMSRVADRMAEQRERLHDLTSTAKDKAVEKHESGPQEQGSSESEAQRNALEGVLGFQPLLLASEAVCCVCGVELKPGEEAFVGVRDTPGPRVLIGPECLPKSEG